MAKYRIVEKEINPIESALNLPEVARKIPRGAAFTCELQIKEKWFQPWKSRRYLGRHTMQKFCDKPNHYIRRLNPKLVPAHKNSPLDIARKQIRE